MDLTKFRPLALAAALCSMSTFVPAIAAPFDEIETVNAAPLASFQKVYIAPVKVELDETNIRRSVSTFRNGRNDRPVSDRDQALKAQDSFEDIAKAFGKSFEVVEAPGEDVLTVETTITKLVSTRPTLADYRVIPGLSFDSIYAGGGEFSIRLSEGETVLTEISDNYITNFNDGLPRIAIWQDYDRASKRIARKLARYVKSS